MQKISATIITLNEERNIDRCLESLRGVVDEIIVVDSMSTDNTKSICERHGVRFIPKAWMGYSDTKNFANEQASHDWILSLDADEALSDEMRAHLLTLKSDSLDGVYEVNRLTNYCGQWIKHCGWFPDIKVRLFPKSISWDGAIVHEDLVVPPSITRHRLNGVLEHYSYYSFEDHRARADKYSVLTAQKMFDQGKRASIIKPILSAVARFISMYLIRKGILDGYFGYKISLISAQSNHFKYTELRRLARENR